MSASIWGLRRPAGTTWRSRTRAFSPPRGGGWCFRPPRRTASRSRRVSTLDRTGTDMLGCRAVRTPPSRAFQWQDLVPLACIATIAAVWGVSAGGDAAAGEADVQRLRDQQ